MIFGINTTSDVSKLLYATSEPLGGWNLRQFWNITSGVYTKYHVQIMLLFVYTTICKRFVIFTCRYFKLRWNTTALSQSNCRNFSCSSIMTETIRYSRLRFSEITKLVMLLPYSEVFLVSSDNDKHTVNEAQNVRVW